MKFKSAGLLSLTILMGALAAPGWAAAATIVEIISGGTNDQPQDLANNYAAIDDVTNIQLVGSGFGCDFQDTTCDVDLSGLNVSFLTVKASNFEALYSVAPGETNVAIDVSTWDDDLGVPGASAFGASWPNRGGNYPAISNIRAWGTGGFENPVPEPSAALVFAGGMLVAATRLRRRR